MDVSPCRKTQVSSQTVIGGRYIWNSHSLGWAENTKSFWEKAVWRKQPVKHILLHTFWQTREMTTSSFAFSFPYTSNNRGCSILFWWALRIAVDSLLCSRPIYLRWWRKRWGSLWLIHMMPHDDLRYILCLWLFSPIRVHLCIKLLTFNLFIHWVFHFNGSCEFLNSHDLTLMTLLFQKFKHFS